MALLCRVNPRFPLPLPGVEVFVEESGDVVLELRDRAVGLGVHSRVAGRSRHDDDVQNVAQAPVPPAESEPGGGPRSRNRARTGQPVVQAGEAPTAILVDRHAEVIPSFRIDSRLQPRQEFPRESSRLLRRPPGHAVVSPHRNWTAKPSAVASAMAR